VLEGQNERLARRFQLQAQGVDFAKALDRVATAFNLKTEHVLSSVKQPLRVKARSVLCYWAVNELEMSGADVARRLNISNSAVSRSVERGEKIATDMKLRLIEN
jgi:chromosomal replication initiation ATPase DnaA